VASVYFLGELDSATPKLHALATCRRPSTVDTAPGG